MSDVGVGVEVGLRKGRCGCGCACGAVCGGSEKQGETPDRGVDAFSANWITY